MDKRNRWKIEVKQTSKDVLIFQSSWLTKLEKFKVSHDLALVVGFALRAKVYYYEGVTTQPVQWSSRSYREDDLPEEIVSPSGGRWVKDDLQSLREIARATT